MNAFPSLSRGDMRSAILTFLTRLQHYERLQNSDDITPYYKRLLRRAKPILSRRLNALDGLIQEDSPESEVVYIRFYLDLIGPT